MRSNEVMLPPSPSCSSPSVRVASRQRKIQSFGTPELSARRSGSAIISVQGTLIAGRPAPRA